MHQGLPQGKDLLDTDDVAAYLRVVGDGLAPRRGPSMPEDR
jgi:hypothetical protein